ncbi:MAG: OmpH family outer membrane protein [Planctomycetota bacterium]|nr:OmpH family outer membrane protein [Planctomycetota bacterium]
MKEEFKKSEAEIENLKKQIKEKTDALRTDPLTGPGSKRFKLGMLKIKELEVELEDKTEEFAKMRRRRMAEFYRSVYEKFQKAVQEYAAKRGLDIVITAPDTELSEESSEADSPIAIQNEILLRHIQYIAPTCDITKDVINLMNANYAKTPKDTKQL